MNKRKVNGKSDYEMVAKLFLLQFYIFCYDFEGSRKKTFTVPKAFGTPQVFLLVFLVSLENIKFRNERVLKPSLCTFFPPACRIFYDTFFISTATTINNKIHSPMFLHGRRRNAYFEGIFM